MAERSWFERVHSERPQLAHRLDGYETDDRGALILHAACGRKFPSEGGGFRQIDLSLVDVKKMCSRCVLKPQEPGAIPWPIAWSAAPPSDEGER